MFLVRLLFFLCFFVGISLPANAVVNFETKDKNLEILYTSFVNYPPFGKYSKIRLNWNTSKEIYDSIFSKFANRFFEENKVKSQLVVSDDYETLIRQVRAGDIEILFGAYYNTKIYDGLDYVMPAVIDNPVVLIMMPKNVNKVKSLNDLQKLKGAIFANDMFNDFVNSEINKYKPIKENDSLEMFRKLFIGEIDYIFASYYYGVAEASSLGLISRISISKQPIWNMPMFIAVSKASPNHVSILQSLNHFIKNKENIQSLNNDLQNAIRELEQKSLHITPPVFD